MDQSGSEVEDQAAAIVRPGKIYLLQGSDGTFYYGSTTRSLTARLRGHRAVSSLPVEKQQLVTSHFSALGWDNVEITLVQEMTCTRQDLMRTEGEIIKKHFDNPLCLNNRITGRFETKGEQFTRSYAEAQGLRVDCECGDNVVQAALPGHLTSEKHAHNMVLKKLPETKEEKPADYYEICECDERVRHYNFPQHILKETHIWKMRIKNLPPDTVLYIPTPPAIDTPEGYNPKVVYCHCQCGEIANREQFSHHLKTMKHIRKMMEVGLIPIPSYQDKPRPELEEGLPLSKRRCPCGAIVSIKGSPREHEETLAHKSKMRELASLKEKAEDPPVEDTPTHVPPRLSFVSAGVSERRSAQVTCECDSVMTAASLKFHMKSEIHADRMKRKQEGKVSPLKNAARLKEKITCVCGVQHARSSGKNHVKTAGHLAYIKDHPE